MNPQLQLQEVRLKLNEIQDVKGKIKKRMILGTPEGYMRQHDIM